MSYNPDTGIKDPYFSLKHLEFSTLETLIVTLPQS